MSDDEVFSKIRFLHLHLPGYGGPESHEIRVVYENRELEKVDCGSSEWNAATTQERLRHKWRQIVGDREAFNDAVARAALASSICVHCGGGTINGVIHCVDKVFCRKCEPFIDQYKKERQEQEAASERNYQAKLECEYIERDARADDAKRGFHWRDGWYFLRLDNGAVRVSHVAQGDYRNGAFVREKWSIEKQFTVPSPEWASIVCSVSAEGETGLRWEASQDFHGRK